MPTNPSLTAIEGLEVGHWTDSAAQTGCTVILCPEEGCVASGDVRGAAPGGRETALLEPEKTVERIHALVFSGGSAFGLAAATGVMRYLEERGVGFETAYGRVPIVPAAVIYDLNMGSARVRPDEAAGYYAARQATAEPVASGRLGAGAGASCGKLFGFEYAQPSGLGSSAVEVGGATLAALAVVNPAGDIVDLEGEVVAGAAGPDGSRPKGGSMTGNMTGSVIPIGNTTLLAIATDAPLSKAQCKALASSAHAGIARVTRPSHTVGDGDTSFVLSTGRGAAAPLMLLSIAVQEVVAAAILRAVRTAHAGVAS
ncbi:MAG: P1 family peptidase [Deinococcota bacterium]|jgi:L-aminopeptidase/D-esterase-like protein|nr:P1 family peptidase [Deinococcota bacterium]